MALKQAHRLGQRIGIEFPASVSHVIVLYGVHTFKAIAAENPVGDVMDGAINVPAEQPRVGERNAVRSKLSEPLLISGRISIKQCFRVKPSLPVALLYFAAFALVFCASVFPLIKRYVVSTLSLWSMSTILKSLVTGQACTVVPFVEVPGGGTAIKPLETAE